MAAEWEEQRNRCPEDLTVSEAVDKYIQSKKNVLSPSTLRGYEATKHNITDPIGEVHLRDLTSVKVQLWISEISGKLSPKTVRNVHGLFTAAVGMFAPDLSFTVTLPASRKYDRALLTDEEFQKLLNHVDGTDLWVAIMLSRYYSLRRSEICGLKPCDLSGNVLTIRRAMVHTTDGEWVLKDVPKTYSSYRYLIIENPLLDVLREYQGDGCIIRCNPDALCNRFNRAVRASKIKKVSFHSLRHMFATQAAMNHVPDIITARMGGWTATSSTLKRVYQNAQDDDLKKEMRRLNKIMQHECNTTKKKTAI